VWSDDGGQVEEKGAKSEAGKRTLPLPSPVSAALLAFQSRQADEKELAGEAYAMTGYVMVDELGQPMRTDWLRRRVHLLMAKANVRKVRLYDARHACLSYLRMSGVPGPIVSAWAGHGDLTDRVYLHDLIPVLILIGHALVIALVGGTWALLEAYKRSKGGPTSNRSNAGRGRLAGGSTG
jgi:integrase